MVKLIIFGLIVLVVFLTRKIWAKYLVKIFIKKKVANAGIDKVGAVFSPSGTVRTFTIAIDIIELGDGTVKMSIAKLKE